MNAIASKFLGLVQNASKGPKTPASAATDDTGSPTERNTNTRPAPSTTEPLQLSLSPDLCGRVLALAGVEFDGATKQRLRELDAEWSAAFERQREFNYSTADKDANRLRIHAEAYGDAPLPADLVKRLSDVGVGAQTAVGWDEEAWKRAYGAITKAAQARKRAVYLATATLLEPLVAGIVEKVNTLGETMAEEEGARFSQLGLPYQPGLPVLTVRGVAKLVHQHFHTHQSATAGARPLDSLLGILPKSIL